jgi:hypothetical protein
MTLLVAMAADPSGALPALPESAPVSPAEAADLYRAAFRDALLAAENSGGELLVNYPEDGEDIARELVAGAEGLAESDTRFEVQVGSSFSARAGNAVTHLLREEGEASVAVLDGRAPLLAHTEIDSAAMRLRRDEAVLAPGPEGAVAFAGFRETPDFEGAWEPPALTTLARRCADSGLSVGFLAHQPTLHTAAGLASLVAAVEAGRSADRALPTHFAAALDELGLGLSGAGLVRA